MPRSRRVRYRSRRSGSLRKRSLKKSAGSRSLKLKKISKSPIRGKKLRAYFSDGTTTDFGASGYSDFTKHKDVSRRKRYIDRHRSRENWKNPKSPGALSRYVLWNKTSLRASISDYKRKFRL